MSSLDNGDVTVVTVMTLVVTVDQWVQWWQSDSVTVDSCDSCDSGDSRDSHDSHGSCDSRDTRTRSGDSGVSDETGNIGNSGDTQLSIRSHKLSVHVGSESFRVKKDEAVWLNSEVHFFLLLFHFSSRFPVFQFLFIFCHLFVLLYARLFSLFSSNLSDVKTKNFFFTICLFEQR